MAANKQKTPNHKQTKKPLSARTAPTIKAALIFSSQSAKRFLFIRALQP